MPFWMDFIGKLIQFFLTKIVGKKIDLHLDQRKRTARTFLDLHEFLLSSEKLAIEFLVELNLVVEGKKERLYMVRAEEISATADEITKKLSTVLYEVGDVLKIYDPSLSRLIWGVYHGKRALMMRTLVPERIVELMKMKVRPGGESIFSIEFTCPCREIEAGEFLELYGELLEVLKGRKSDLSRATQYSLPEDGFLTRAQEICESKVVGAADIDTFRDLKNLIERQLAVLSAARGGVAAFLRENFSIEDLLHSGGHSCPK